MDYLNRKALVMVHSVIVTVSNAIIATVLPACVENGVFSTLKIDQVLLSELRDNTYASGSEIEKCKKAWQDYT